MQSKKLILSYLLEVVKPPRLSVFLPYLLACLHYLTNL